jgi:hypothetical protein
MSFIYKLLLIYLRSFLQNGRADALPKRPYPVSRIPKKEGKPIGFPSLGFMIT